MNNLRGYLINRVIEMMTDVDGKMHFNNMRWRNVAPFILQMLDRPHESKQTLRSIKNGELQFTYQDLDALNDAQLAMLFERVTCYFYRQM